MKQGALHVTTLCLKNIQLCVVDKHGAHPILCGLGTIQNHHANQLLKSNQPYEVLGKTFFMWVDNYRKANPLDFLSDGANQLAFELMRKTPVK
jgi:hypothetical protein